MTSAADRLSAALSGRYRIERELGGGGMSRVFLATELQLDRRVVIKILSPDLAAGVSASRFEREIRLAASLQQANIVPLLSAGTADYVPYYSMPYVEGESLRARIASAGPLAIAEAVGILRDVARALSYAHAHGVVHRDIKPDNVLLSHGAAVVTDFGIAKAISAARAEAGAGSLTQTGMSLGTPAYMAPEQAAGEPDVDHRADLYAFGCLAYEILGGQPPFHGRTTQKTVAAHLTEIPAPVESARPDTPAPLATLVAQCLEKDPADRPPSADAVLEVLGAVPTGSGEQRQPGSGAGRATPGASSETSPSQRPSRRPSRRALLAGTGAVVMVAAGVLALKSLRPRADAAPNSLAVIPFESVGGDTANTYFAEGMSDELATELARVPGVRVAARTSAATFRGRATKVEDIGRQLRVGSVLTGSVRRAGTRVRIAAQLASTRDGLVLWSDSFERDSKDVFAMQDSISAAIVGALRGKLGTSIPSARLHGQSHGTTNLEAYDLYLRGMYFYGKRGRALTTAVDYFRQATAKDPSFARAYAGMAIALQSVLNVMGTADAGAVMQAGDSAARRAIALDSTLSDGHLGMALIHQMAGRWTAARSEYERAIAIDPDNALAHHQFGRYLTDFMAEYQHGTAELRRALDLDPLDASACGMLGYALLGMGQVDDAIRVARRGMEIDSTLGPPRGALMLAYLAGGRPAEARAVALRGGAPTTARGIDAYALAKAGDRESAGRIVAELERLPDDDPGKESLGYGYLGLGDTARALTRFEENVQRSFVIRQSWGLPEFDGLRSSPRFAALIQAYGLDVKRLTSPRGGRP